MDKLVIALGGNALTTKNQKGTYKELTTNINKTCKSLAKINKNILIVSGSGPQVGALLLQNELAKHKVPKMPLDVLDAELEGELGYLISQSFLNYSKKPIATVITQVLVDKKDPAFKNPSKPIGPFYKTKKKGYKQDAGRGYRRVVPSPKPIDIIEGKTIKKLIKTTNVIAAGGGGIPVYKTKGKLKGLEAVIDKDKAASLLAKKIKAKELLILTTVPQVYTNFGKPNQHPIKQMNRKQAQIYLKQGHFLPGSMKPKIEASIEFLKKGKKVTITNIQNIEKALKGRAGTIITK
tara:strand:+ start:99 stop:977 length:879 start_codon:yes stop_codon:yes gene_type:complete